MWKGAIDEHEPHRNRGGADAAGSGRDADAPCPEAAQEPLAGPHLYNLVDAFRTAALINARSLGGLPAPEEEAFESPLWGGSLLVLGLLLLLNNLGWLHLASLARYWPLALIVAGAAFLYSAIQRRRGNGGRAPASLETRDGGSL